MSGTERGVGGGGIDWDRYRRFAIPTVFGVGLISILLLGLAMLVYPGGSQQDHNLQHFSFYQNYLCDLGRTVNFRGESNTLSSVLLRISLSIIGIGSAFFMAGLPTMVPRGKRRVLAIIGAVTGSIAGVAYVGIGNTPWNILQFYHSWSIYTALGANAVMCLFLFLGMKQAPLPKISRFLYLPPLFFILEYAVHINLGWPAPNFIQKFVVFSLIGCFIIQALLIMRYQIRIRRSTSATAGSVQRLSTIPVGTEK